MPSWPADDRDDEVWAVTAFLLKLPEIDADRYSRLATGAGLSSPSEPLAAPSKGPEDLDMLPSPGLSTLAGENQSPITTCAQCHGLDGRGRDGDAFPNISGQKAAYLRATLEDYAAGVRHSGIMQPVAHALTKAQIETLVEHFSAFEWQQAAQPAGEPTGDLELGRRIAEQGKQDQSVPACKSCHDEAGADLRPHFPRIAGQHESFIRQQLELFRDKKRGGRRAALMQGTAERMSDKEIAAVAAYYARLKPGAPQPSQRSEME